MAQGKQALKNRIRTINATKKITSAMELIANAKLKKQRVMMEENREYAGVLKETVQKILNQAEDAENIYLKAHKSEKVCTILISSDLGLCGGYNSNMLKLAEAELAKEDPMIVIGTRGYSWLKNRGFTILNEPINSDAVTFNQLSKQINRVLDMFASDEICRIQVLYTVFVNSVTFRPRMLTLLPVTREERGNENQEMMFEPAADEILENLIPMYVRSLVYSAWLQSKTAEQASRRMAMESATDNAEELTDKLVLQFNQARQAAITQEITEIVGGADAL